MDRYGRLRLLKHPVHGLVLESTDRAVLTEVLRSRKVTPLVGARIDDDTVAVHPSERGAIKAGPAAPGMAGRGPRRVRRRRGPSDRAGPGRLAAARLPAPGCRGVLARRIRCCRPAVRRGQDPGGRRRDGPGQGDDADPGDEHGLRAPVARRAAQAHEPDRGRDRRVLGRAQGGPAGHDRDLSGDDHEAKGHLRPPRPVRRPRLGPDHLRRGPPAAGPDLPVHRRHPGTPPTGPDGHARARGRSRGRRLLADRPQALRRAVARDRGAGLDRPGRLRRGARHAARCPADGLRDGRARRALPDGRHRAREAGDRVHPGGPAPRRPGAGDRAVPRPAPRARRACSASR